MTTANQQSESPIVGLLVEFDGPEALKAAAAGLKTAGYTRCEAYSPYPVHGLDAILGRKRSLIPWMVLGGGFTGCVVALLLQWWTNAVDYPYLISGKPLFSLPANIPVTFELIILFGALAAFGGVLLLTNLPRPYHPLFGCEKFRRVTTDAFFLTVDAADPKFDEAATADLLRWLGAKSVEPYRNPASRRDVPGVLKAAVTLLIALSVLPVFLIAVHRYERKSKPRIHPLQDMAFQPKYLPQQSSPLFADGRDMRPPVPGAVAADALIDQDHFLHGTINGRPATTFPVPVTAEMMHRGRERFAIFCATCHGLAGDGDGVTAQLAFEREEPKWVRPLSLHNASVVSQPVGQIFATVSNGIRTMPSYSSQIPVEDRWAIILYVRALQRTRTATMKDVPKEYRKLLERIERSDAGTRAKRP